MWWAHDRPCHLKSHESLCQQIQKEWELTWISPKRLEIQIAANIIGVAYDTSLTEVLGKEQENMERKKLNSFWARKPNKSKLINSLSIK